MKGTSIARWKDLLQYHLRCFTYRVVRRKALAFLKSRNTRPSVEAEAEAWDEKLIGACASYLDHTLETILRARVTATLVNAQPRPVRSVLDIGCGAGVLAPMLASFGCQRYLGIDISHVAVERERRGLESSPEQHPAETDFEINSLEEFVSSSFQRESRGLFDAMIFNEVLYYLPTPEEALGHVLRAMSLLAPFGVIIVSMKDDGKSHAIWRLLRQNMLFQRSVLFQEQGERASYRIRVDRRSPAFLVGRFSRADEHAIHQSKGAKGSLGGRSGG